MGSSSKPQRGENVVFPEEIHAFHSKVLVFLRKINKMEGLRVAQGRQEEICENPGRPNPYGFLLNPLKNIAILARPKGDLTGGSRRRGAAASLREAKTLYFVRKYMHFIQKH